MRLKERHMKFCPACGRKNDQIALYCESCGVAIEAKPSSSNVTERGSGYEVAGLTPPPPPIYEPQNGSSNPPNSAEARQYAQPASFSYPPILERAIGAQREYWREEVATPQQPKRTVGRIIINCFLYFWGILSSAFGASGLLLQGDSSTLVGAVFIGYCLGGVAVLVPTLIAHKQLLLRTRMRWLYAVIATVVAGVLAMLCGAILSGQQNALTLSHFLGVVFIIYGIAISILALI